MGETYRTQTLRPQAEAANNPTDVIAASFAQSYNTLQKLTADTRFHAELISKEIHPFDGIGTEAYAGVLAEFAAKTVKNVREKHGDSLALRTFELLATTPRFIFDRHKLDQPGIIDPSARTRLCKYGAQIHELVSQHPDARPAATGAALAKTALAFTRTPKEIRSKIQTIINDELQGVKHEVGFADMLAAAGRLTRPGTVEEDLSGIDIWVGSRRRPSKMLPLDIKATLTEVHTKETTDLPFRIATNGHIVMYSMLGNTDFDPDSFHPSQSAIANKSKIFDDMLEYAEQALVSA